MKKPKEEKEEKVKQNKDFTQGKHIVLCPHCESTFDITDYIRILEMRFNEALKDALAKYQLL